jgi:hypothetical protein
VSKRRKSPGTGTPRPRSREAFVPRPFEGLVDEREWIALRELVPAASAPLVLKPEVAAQFEDRAAQLATVLPMAWPAMARPDGRVLVGLQRHRHSADPSRDLGTALLCALRTAPGEPVAVPDPPGDGPRLQDVLAAQPLAVTLHDSFEFWLEGGVAEDADVKASMERANASIYPTAKLAAAPAAYWCRVPDRAHLRWVLPEDEDRALDALARLNAAGQLGLGEQTRFAGMFRAHGRLVPVWDLPREPDAPAWEAPLAGVAQRYAEALGDASLTPAERRCRHGLLGRQLTLR